MTTSAGKVGIQITADDSELQAVMKRAAAAATTAFKGMASSAISLRGVLGTVAAGAAAGYFGSLVTDSIKAQARMKDLAQEAGTTASAISRFDAPARMAGVGLDAVAGAMFKMSQAALEAKDPASNAAQALKSIGISTAQLKGLKPDEMFELVARSLGNYGDGLEKNAVQHVLFGRSGREMNKVVAEIASSGKLMATVTDQQTEAADALGDELVKLNMESEKLWRGISSRMVPTMNSVLKAFNEGARDAGLFAGALTGLSAAYKLATDEAGKFFGDPFKNRILAIENELVTLKKVSAQGPGLLERITGIDKSQEITDRIRKLQAELTGLYSLIGTKPGAPPAPAATDKPKPDFDPAARAAAAAAARKAEADRIKEAELALRRSAQAYKAEEDAREENRKDQAADDKLRWDSIKATEAVVASIQFETTLIGLSNEERERAIALRTLETGWIGKQDDAYVRATKSLQEALTAQQAARVKQDQEMRAQMELLQSQSNFVGAFEDGLSAFIDGTKNAKDAFKDFIRSVEQQLSRLAAQDIANSIFGGKGSGSSSGLYSFLSSFAGFFGSGSGGLGYGTAGSVIPPGGPYAKGGVFDRGGELAKFASGGIFGSPTAFAFAGGMGVMGEAGPEAVMPLARDRSGRLGVRGGGTTIISPTFNISTPDANSFRQSESQIAASMTKMLARGNRSR